jgi:ribonuclease BN (tRNA processing enzyme)
MGATLVRLAGTGTAFHLDGRGSSCLLVEPDGAEPFLVDVGPTAVSVMQRFEWDERRLARLFVTHLHGDHIAGWPFLLLNLAWLHHRREPFEVFGPLGTRERLEGLARLCFGDLLERSNLGFELRFQELEVAEATELSAGPIRFDVGPLEHHPSSIGYRFRLADGTLGVSGDTRWCAGLARLAEGCDLLVTECTELEPGEQAHLSLGELRARASELGNGRVLLVHLTDEVAAALAADPIPGMVAGHDGMELPLSR